MAAIERLESLNGLPAGSLRLTPIRKNSMESATANGSESAMPRNKSVQSPDAFVHPNPKAKYGSQQPNMPSLVLARDFVDLSHLSRKYFASIGAGGLLEAFEKVNNDRKAASLSAIISKKKPGLLGREVPPGSLGHYTNRGLDKFIVRPGNYASALQGGNWIGRDWDKNPLTRVVDLNEEVIQISNLTILRVTSNAVAVVQDPDRKVFIIRDGGFVAYPTHGRYCVLAVVDQTNLQGVSERANGGRLNAGQSTSYMDTITGNLLGTVRQVKTANASELSIAATFLDVRPWCIAIISRGQQVEALPAGQHIVTEQGVEFSQFLSLGEQQKQLPEQQVFTLDGVELNLIVNLRWRLVDPLLFAAHTYANPYAALLDKSRSVLAWLGTQQRWSDFNKQSSVTATIAQAASGTPFDEALRLNARDAIHEAAQDYGIDVVAVEIVSRRFDGDVVRQMEQFTISAMAANSQSQQQQLINENKRTVQEGLLKVAEVEARQQKTTASGRAEAVVTQAEGDAKAQLIRADAEAQAIRLKASAEAQRIRDIAEANASVSNAYAQEMTYREMNVRMAAAYASGANTTIFAGTREGLESYASNYVQGKAWSAGAGAFKTN